MNVYLMPQNETRASVQRESVHPSITECQISQLVERFYQRVLSNERLGPVFKQHAGDTWNKHLDTMKRFWRSVLLRSGEYKGKPVQVHKKIEGIETDDFEEWLSLFELTTSEIFAPEVAPLINDAAHRIASSLWLARSSDPFSSPPNWQSRLGSH